MAVPVRAFAADAAFHSFHKPLQPRGILGVQEHHARTEQPREPQAKSGYARHEFAIALAEKAGFTLLGSSEVNANPKDAKDNPEGAQTLPPTYRLKDQDREKYAAIGESDRFVLKFAKRAETQQPRRFFTVSSWGGMQWGSPQVAMSLSWRLPNWLHT